MTRLLLLFVVLLAVTGCVHPPKSESDVLLDIRQLTTGFGRAGEGYFSADSNWVIFQATPPGERQYQMYVARTIQQRGDIVGLTRPVRISPSGSSNTCGFFSPDNSTLIFSSNAGKENPEAPGQGFQRSSGSYTWNFEKGMEIYRVDGWQAAIAAADPQRGVNLAQHKLTDNDFYDAEASFSPDGKHIVFTSNRDGDLDIYVMRPDGTNVTRITNKPGYDGGPFFSPDGRFILYRSDRKGDKAMQVFASELTFDGAGSITGVERETQLTGDGHLNWGPFFHPTTWSVIYASSQLGHDNYELFMQRFDGTKRCRITFTAGADVLPVFSSDGRYMMWSSKRTADNTTQLFIARFVYPKYLR
jgi:TolB protein